MPRTLEQLTMKVVAAAALLAALSSSAGAMGSMIDGVAGPSFDLVAEEGYVSSGDGNVHYTWGYGTARMQYPGPTLLVNEGDTVTVRLTNSLPVPTSIVFPGQVGVSATKTAGDPSAPPGPLVLEAGPGETVEYSFTASRPGTFLYHSGTSPELQIEMGLVGALIVRPAGFMTDGGPMRAYGHAGTWFDSEVLVLETEMDPRIHLQAEYGVLDQLDTTTFFPTIWFINGRTAPDTMADAGVGWLPNQPYNCMPMMHPGQRVLMRLVSAGRDLHPFHTHGNHTTLLARDAHVLHGGGAVDPLGRPYPDLSERLFTISVPPGGTADAVYEWTGAGLGWDVYGHKPDKKGVCPPLAQGEDPGDHCKTFPVVLPDQKDVTAGEFYGGSPFLGKTGAVPPGQPAETGYYHMWHSHNEKEITTDDVFPGGLMTMIRIEPWGVPLPGESAGGM
jgi:FtsP/CotA-like multicopper oxidase with cupredoxin domain